MTTWSKLNWLVTGASSGFGLEITKAVLEAGGQVAAGTRNPDKLAALFERYPDRLLPIAMDVGDPGSTASAAAQAMAKLGDIDVLVNNAGYTLLGAVEEVSEAEYRPLFEVNFFGVAALTKLLLSGMRARRRGFIVNFSSVSGVVGSAGSPYYAAAKFAVEGWSDALRAEGGPFGINVMIVQPGPFRTEFYGAKRLLPAVAIPEYANVHARRSSAIEQLGAQPGDPARGAAAVLAAMEAAKPPARLPLGAIAVDLIRDVYRNKADEAEAWAELSRSADFD